MLERMRLALTGEPRKGEAMRQGVSRDFGMSSSEHCIVSIENLGAIGAGLLALEACIRVSIFAWAK